MQPNNIDFLKEYKFTVQVFDDELGEIGAAELLFGPERWSHIDFGIGIRSKVSGLPKGKLQRPLKAITSDGMRFTLFDCTRFDSSIGIGYVVAGEAPSQFKKITIRYSDISEWFLPWGSIDNTDRETITWREPQHISAKIQVEEAQLLLTTISEMSVKHEREDHIFHQHILFCLEHLTGSFSPEKAREKVLELSNLLSILIAHPLFIISVEITAESGSRHELFFSTFKPTQRDFSSFWIRCFTQYGKIYDRWETIFNHYFNSEYRKVSWARLAGMQRYEGFWEYKALGHVSLLDKYVDQRTKSRAKINVPAKASAIRQLERLLSRVSPSLQQGQYQTVLSVVKDVFSRERDLNFSEKYRQVISECNPHVIKAINISDTDFKLIKEVRDKIAHGEAVEVAEGDFTPINKVVSKIVLLMTYWFFLEVGLHDSDFLECLDFTRGSLKLMADPDRVHLDRVLRPDHFLSVTNSEFEKISKAKNIKLCACFVRSRSGTIRYSKKFSDREAKWRTQKNAKSGITPHSKMLGVDESRITYLSSISSVPTFDD